MKELNVYKNPVQNDPDGLSEEEAVSRDLRHFLATMPEPNGEDDVEPNSSKTTERK